MSVITLKEIVGVSMSSRHMEHMVRECPIDRVGALARAGKLAARLWAWKYGGDATSGVDALRVLVRIAAKRLKIRHVGERGKCDYMILRRACEQVLLEWFHPQCHRCGGAGTFMTDEVKVICPVCEGHAIHRFSNGERMRVLQVSERDFRRWDNVLSEIFEIVNWHDARAQRCVRKQLERCL